MSKLRYISLTAVVALAVVFALSCASTAGGGNGGYVVQGGNFKKAKKYHNAAAKKMQQLGENDAEVLKLYKQAIEEYRGCIAVRDKNSGEANQYLGRILYTGPSSLRSYKDALRYLRDALDIYEKEKKEGDFIPLCYNELGAVQYRLGDYFSAYLNWKRSSELSGQFAGDEAQLYWLGLGVEQNLSKAMELYKSAALAGRDLWANIYALSYQIKEYEKGNYENEGMDLFLSYLNSKSMGEPKETWMSILTQAADLGNPPAQVDLWVYCRDDKKYEQGMPYLQKAVAAGYIPAYFHMGYIYHMGLNNTKTDFKEAQKWYEKAAAEGFPIAQSNLGGMYFMNQITAGPGNSNQEMAAYWWKVSADQGFPLAIYNQKLVANYRTPLETSIQLLSSVASIMNASMDIYKTLNKSSVPAYIPSSDRLGSAGQAPSANTNKAAPGQNNSSTASSSASGNTKVKMPCPLCKGSGECSYQGWGLNSCKKGLLDCTTCDGKGSYRGEICKTCKGTRKVKCGVCHGTGVCGRCRGAKYI